MLRIYIELSSEWTLWPLWGTCLCEDSPATYYRLPFMSLYVVREKVATP